VLRLAAVYALLDRSLIIERAHLEAALEFWRYSEESARYIWGDALGDPLADELLDLLRARPEGLTRTDINAMVFKGHHSAEKIGAVLTLLTEQGLAYPTREETGGRPAERWRLTTGSIEATLEDAKKEKNANEEVFGSPTSPDNSHVSLSTQLREAAAKLAPQPCTNCTAASKCTAHEDRF
jgi:hypothetical protein